MKRGILFLVIVTVFVVVWRLLDEIPLRVIGQPSSTGLLTQQREVPFFRNLAATTGVPFKVTYLPTEAVGFKDTHQLQMLKVGMVDLVSLRFLQNSAAEPALQGIDLVGLNFDFPTAEKVIRAYAPTLDRYLQERFSVKLLGVWTFGPQEIFCRTPIGRIEDLKGLRVRVGGASLATCITELGGTPAIIPFDDTKHALATGLVDCAVTSAASANYAGWPEHASHYFPLAVHFGINGYAISLTKWQSLTRREQVLLQGAFDAYLADLWHFTQEIRRDAFLCNTGRDCRYGKRYQMALVKPSAHDVQLVREITINKVFPEWAEQCEKIHPGCREEWQEKLAPLLYRPRSQSPPS